MNFNKDQAEAMMREYGYSKHSDCRDLVIAAYERGMREQFEATEMWRQLVDKHATECERLKKELEALKAEKQATQNEPVAEAWWGKDTDYEWQVKILVEMAVPEGERVKLYAGHYTSTPLMYINQDGSFHVSKGD